MKSIIIYYSYGGNTRTIAEAIHEQKGYDMVEIKPVIPYTNDYQKLVDEEENKMHQEEMVEIEPININLSDCDTIILGTPVWWYTMTPPVRSFLKNNDLTDKTIIPFATNGGWLGRAFDDIKKYAPNSKVENAMNIKFNEHTLETSHSIINNWISSL